MPKVESITDESLMIEVKHGNLKAMGILFERYQTMVFNFFRRFGHCSETRSDLTQTVFYRALRYRHTYNERGAFRSWIFQLARNSSYDHSRKNRHTTVPFEDAIQPSSGFYAGQDFIQIDKREQRQQLDQALQTLPKDYREVIILHRFNHLKYEEIARMQKSTVAAVKIKAHRAIKKMKHYFENIAAKERRTNRHEM